METKALMKKLLIICALMAGTAFAEKVHFGELRDISSLNNLDLDGEIVYAVNIGGPAVRVGNIQFGADDEDNVTANNEKPGTQVSRHVRGYYPNLNGKSGPHHPLSLGDQNLETVMRYLRNDSMSRTVVMDVEKGVEYKLQVMAADKTGLLDRRFNLTIEGRLAVENFEQKKPRVYSTTFKAGDNKLEVNFNVASEGEDRNPDIAGITLEKSPKDNPPRRKVSRSVHRPILDHRKPQHDKRTYGDGEVNDKINNLLPRIRDYQDGQVKGEIQELAELIISVSGNRNQEVIVEKAFVTFLEGNPSFAAKQVACRKLRMIGKSHCIPVLSRMLFDDKTASAARYALESNMDPAAENGLLAALNQTNGKTKAGMITSLAVRRSAKAVQPISKLMFDSHGEIADAAVDSLGKIGGAEALSALTAALTKKSGFRKERVMQAMIKCADFMVAEEERNARIGVYKELCSSDSPSPVRISALKGMLDMGLSKKSVGAVTRKVAALLTSKDGDTSAIGVALIRDLPQGVDVSSVVAAALPGCVPHVQEQVIYALADRGDKSVQNAVKALAKSPEDYVRIAVSEALGKIGDAGCVERLANMVVNSRGDEKKSAEKALRLLKGEDVDSKLVELVPHAESKTKVVLIDAIGERFSQGAGDVLVAVITGDDAKAASAAAKALSKVAGDSDVPGLIKLLLATENASMRKRIETTLASAVGRMEDQSMCSRVILDAMGNVNDKEKKLSFIRVLGQIAVSESTAAAIEIVKNGDGDERLAAAEGLSKGDVFEAIPALLALVRSEDDLKRHVLAIRATLNLLNTKETDRDRDVTVAGLSSLLSNAMRMEDRNMILASLAVDENRCEFGYLVARACMQYPELRPAAKLAADKINESHGNTLSEQPYWGEFAGKYDGRDARGIVVPEKHSDRQRLSFKIRVVGDGFEESFEGRFHERKILIDNNGWRGEIKDGTFKARKDNREIDMDYHERRSPTLGQSPPDGAVVLFPFEAGKVTSLEKWDNDTWTLMADGSLEVGRGYCKTKQEFGSCQLHIEFATPFMPYEFGQGRGNSGVYMMGRYEVQVLDSFGDNPGEGNCGGIYGNATPRVPHVQLPPLQWQTYDITFRAPEIDGNGNLTRRACFEKVVHNGVLIHENIEVEKPTGASVWNDQKPKGSLALQDHGDLVRFRNVWIVEK
jgi:HEAT repeat protein